MTIVILNYTSGVAYVRETGSLDPEKYIKEELNMNLNNISWMEIKNLDIDLWL